MSGRPFGDRYRATLVGAGAPPDAPTAESFPARGGAGYSFWQRYWASFIGVDLPVRPERAAAQADIAFAASLPALKRRRDGTLSDAELDALLRRLDDLAVGLVPTNVSAETPDALALVSLESDNAATFGVSLRLIPALGRLLPVPLTVALVSDRTYFVARVSPDGSGTFRNVPAGAWSFRRIGRLERGLSTLQGEASRSGHSRNYAVALPTPRTGGSLAAASTDRSAVLRIVLPEATLVLHRGIGDEFLIEVIDTEPDVAPLIVTIRYGTMSGAAQDLVIPVAGKGALVRVPGYTPAVPWEASVVSASQFQGWDPEQISLSVRATANNATRRAWRAISEFATAEIRDRIEAELR